MAEITPGDDPDVHQALIALMDRADRFEEQLDQAIDRIEQLEAKMQKIEDTYYLE